MNAKEQPVAIHLADYRPPDWRILHTDLVFEIGEGATEVTSSLELVAQGTESSLVLDGQDLTVGLQGVVAAGHGER